MGEEGDGDGRIKVTFGYGESESSLGYVESCSREKGLWRPSRVLGEEHTHQESTDRQEGLCVVRLEESAVRTGPGSYARPAPLLLLILTFLFCRPRTLPQFTLYRVPLVA